MAKKKNRRRLFVNPKVQGALVGRAVIYWWLGLLALSGPLYLFGMHPGILVDNGPWILIRPVLITSFALLPIVLLGVVKHSNKIVGPMLRMRRAMQQVREGKPVEPVRLRKGDFWHEFAEDLNAVIELAQTQKGQVSRTQAPSDENSYPSEAQSQSDLPSEQTYEVSGV